MDVGISQPSYSRRARDTVSAFTDELEGELEKISVFGVHMTRRVVLSIIGIFVLSAAAIGVSLGGGSSNTRGGVNQSAFGKDHRYWTVGEVIESSVGKSIYDNTTNRHTALLWLADEDPMRLDETAPLEELLQRFVLAYFYYATNGDSWTNQYHFLSKKSVCDWNDKTSGVFCNDKKQVSSILLPEANLVGSMPHDIGLLSNMEIMNVTKNGMSGTIPLSFGIMSSLTSLDLSFNSFNGPIPKSFAMLLDLVLLNLSYNQLEGRDDIDALKMLPKLEELQLSFNKLEGNVGQFGESSSLRHIDLSNNKIGGTISHKVTDGKRLESLKLNNNLIRGTIPDTFGKLFNMVELDLSNNDITGSLPTTFGDLVMLQTLKLNSNKLQYGLPSELESLDELSVLEISKNGIETIPNELFNMKNLQTLSLGSNFIAGSLPSEVGLATSLVKLDLSDNKITNKLPSEVGNLSSLEYLYLNGNLFDGEVPADLSKLSLLREMDISNNNFFGDMEAQFCNRPDGGNPIENYKADCLTGDIDLPCATECCTRDNYCCLASNTDCMEENMQVNGN